jgi:hypothetical protein
MSLGFLWPESFLLEGHAGLTMGFVQWGHYQPINQPIRQAKKSLGRPLQFGQNGRPTEKASTRQDVSRYFYGNRIQSSYHSALSI